jgi:hypothetical protein
MKAAKIRTMSSEIESTPETEQESEPVQAQQDDVKPRVKISGQDKQILKETLTRFTSCGRCSLFLAAYRLNHDDVEMLAVVNDIEDGWLALPWDSHVRGLINKSYGWRIDMESFYFESCCPECHGTFVYSGPENGEPNTLRVKM